LKDWWNKGLVALPKPHQSNLPNLNRIVRAIMITNQDKNNDIYICTNCGQTFMVDKGVNPPKQCYVCKNKNIVRKIDGGVITK